LPAISSLRAGVAMRSNTVTRQPAAASRVAAISPAGPAPTTVALRQESGRIIGAA